MSSTQITVTEAMKELGTKNRQLIMNMINDKTITAQKQGWVWLLDRASVLKAKAKRAKSRK